MEGTCQTHDDLQFPGDDGEYGCFQDHNSVIYGGTFTCPVVYSFLFVLD